MPTIHAIFLLTVRRIRMFFSLKLLHPKGNHPSKFQIAGVRRFGGVREHPYRQTDTHWQTGAFIVWYMRCMTKCTWYNQYFYFTTYFQNFYRRGKFMMEVFLCLQLQVIYQHSTSTNHLLAYKPPFMNNFKTLSNLSQYITIWCTEIYLILN